MLAPLHPPVGTKERLARHEQRNSLKQEIIDEIA
jgi:hypothetical protein